MEYRYLVAVVEYRYLVADIVTLLLSWKIVTLLLSWNLVTLVMPWISSPTDVVESRAVPLLKTYVYSSEKDTLMNSMCHTVR